MSASSHYKNFAAYNRWANERIYEAVAGITQEEYTLDRGMFFKSFHGTLNHLLVTDYMWAHRITGEGPRPEALDEILFDDLLSLRAARTDMDERLISLIEGFEKKDYGRIYEYKTVSYGQRKDILAIILSHLFNHQTHHRGQIHNCLSQMGLKPPALDLIFFMREQEKAV